VRAARRRINRGKLPAHRPRIETVIDVESTVCPCCGGLMHRIGEDVSERLDVVPAQFRVLVTRRPKYACRACSEAVVQAPAPARLIEGGLPTEATMLTRNDHGRCGYRGRRTQRWHSISDEGAVG
jgi:transposase